MTKEKTQKFHRPLIAQVIVEMVLRGQHSLLDVDGQMRLFEYRTWHQSNRNMVVSDPTLFRSLASFDLEPVHATLWAEARQMRDQALRRVYLPSGRRSRLGLLDGSGWGDFLGSVLTLRDDVMDVVSGYRMSPGKGHELETSRDLLREAVNELGEGFIDHLVADGLHMTGSDFSLAQEAGFHLVVKTKEETLTVIQQARDIFFLDQTWSGLDLEKREGFDAKRDCRYDITAVAFIRPPASCFS